MSTVTGGQGNIVTNGLVLNLDAANPRSYPQPYNGATWFDISGNSRNGTLTNGPIYNSANGGSIIFDGSNDYTEQTIPYYPTFTIFIWVYPISGTGLMLYGNSGSTPILLLDYNTSGNLRIYVSDYYQTFNSALIINKWNLITVIANQSSLTREVFVNSVSKGSNTYAVNSQTGIFRLGVQNFIGYGNCRIAQTSIYNRALSSQEVLQNFNATRARFGV